MKKVSFDFDGTLEYKEVQDYAKGLVESGYEVWIVTTRWKDPSKYYHHVTHKDIHEAMEYIGIPESQVHFNDMEYKYTFFKNNQDFLFHLDDNDEEKDWMDQEGVKVPVVIFGILHKHECFDECDKILEN